jgi:hypothetical protein
MPLIPWPAGWRTVEPPEEIRAQLDAIPPPVLLLSAFALGSLTTVSGTLVYRRYFRRLKNGNPSRPFLLRS